MHSLFNEPCTTTDSSANRPSANPDTVKKTVQPSQRDFIMLLLQRRSEILEQETSAQLAVEHQLREIRIAMRRLEIGIFGICENCDEPIAVARLLRIPTARCCVTCQSQFEQSQKRKPGMPC